MSEDGADGWTTSFYVGALHHVTGEAVAEALNGFALHLVENWSMDMLAGKVRLAWQWSAAWQSGGHAPKIYGPGRVSDAEASIKLRKLADFAAKMASELDEGALGCSAQTALLQYSADADGQLKHSPSPEYWRFLRAVKEVDWLATYFNLVADGLHVRTGPSQAPEIRKLRIDQGRELVPIFEAAFGKRASVNNSPSGGDHYKPSNFMDFYVRMMTLAFDEKSVNDLSGVLKEACKQHRKS